MDANNHEPEGKGKAKAEGAAPENESSGDKASTSLRTRIANSARGLLQDAIAPGGDTAQTLSSSLAFGDKVRASGGSGAASRTAQDLGSSQRAGSNISGGIQSSRHGLQDGVRAETENDGVQQEFDAFSTSRTGLETDDILKTKEMEASWDRLTKTANVQALEPVQKHEQIEYDDGAEVRALLADPNFNAQAEEGSFNFDQGPEQTVDDLFPQNFSAEDQSMINQFQASLPQPPVHRSANPNHPLSLRPRSEEEKQAVEENIENILNGTFTVQQTSMDVIGDEWLDNWIGVLDGYTDEVWGDMLPIVRETRAQLEEVKKGEMAVDNKAVARLKMILGHLEMN